MTANEPQPPAPPYKLRWYQWRLRTLFVLTLLVAIGMSWLAVTIQNQRKQKAAAEAIRKTGGTVTCKPTWLGKLLRDDSLVIVTIVQRWPSANDARLADLEGLSQLTFVNLYNSEVTDAGLAHLEGLSQLRFLGLSDTKVTDAGLMHLQGMSRLRLLFLNGTKVTDAGLAHLDGLNCLDT
ncbi:MAG: hypothetical protein WAU84_06360, partial [Thermoguttaceae bacterium]